jgi:hypothetical protein
MKHISLIAAVLFIGCASKQPKPLPQEVRVPVAVSCIKFDLVPSKPEYESLRDNDSAPDGALVLHVTRDFAKSLPYQAQLEALVEACR